MTSDGALPGYAFESAAPDVTHRRLSPALRQRIARLAPSRIEASGDEVTLVAEGLEGDTERLAEAAAIAEALAEAAPGEAYR